MTDVEGSVRLMQQASADVAEAVRVGLESRFLPNQVVMPGAAELVPAVVAGLASASEAGRLESWELLAQLAAGGVLPTAADERVVHEVRLAVLGVLDVAVARVISAAPSDIDYLAVDVLDAALNFADEPRRVDIVAALTRFATRDAAARSRVRIALGEQM